MKHSSIAICASVLSADFAQLGEQVRVAERAGVDRLHLDVMDGLFVPNFSMGQRIVAAVNRSTDLFLSVHLMIYNPFAHIESFVEAGADQITFHFEATEDIEDTIDFIKKCGIRVGIAIRPETKVSLITRYLPFIDELLIMTVHPGFGGQRLLKGTIDKIREARHYVDAVEATSGRAPVDVAVDGGLNEETTGICVAAGANVIVAGSAIFNAPDMQEAVETLRRNACQARRDR